MNSFKPYLGRVVFDWPESNLEPGHLQALAELGQSVPLEFVPFVLLEPSGNITSLGYINDYKEKDGYHYSITWRSDD